MEVGQSLIFAVVVAALLLLTVNACRASSRAARQRGPGLPRDAGIARAAVTYFTVRIRINAVTALGAARRCWSSSASTIRCCGRSRAFFLSFVPYLGLVLAMIPPTILALAESGPLAAAAFVVGGTALNLIAENVLEPTLTGRALSLSTWLVFTMFFFWVWLLGPVGALLSMPITVLVVLVLRAQRAHPSGSRPAHPRAGGSPRTGPSRRPGRRPPAARRSGCIARVGCRDDRAGDRSPLPGPAAAGDRAGARRSRPCSGSPGR